MTPLSKLCREMIEKRAKATQGTFVLSSGLSKKMPSICVKQSEFHNTMLMEFFFGVSSSREEGISNAEFVAFAANHIKEICDGYLDSVASYEGMLTDMALKNIDANFEIIKLLEENGRLKLEVSFIKEYLNPADTSFRIMIDSFKLLSKDKQDKLINLSKSLADMKGGGG